MSAVSTKESFVSPTLTFQLPGIGTGRDFRVATNQSAVRGSSKGGCALTGKVRESCALPGMHISRLQTSSFNAAPNLTGCVARLAFGCIGTINVTEFS